MKAILTVTLGCVLAARGLAADVGAEALLPVSPRPAHEPHVAYGDGKYLVVWQSGRAENGDIYGCRVDEAGKPLDAQPFCISKAAECQERPRVAWGKGAWLVVWGDLRNDKDYDVYAARVSADGKVLDPDGVPIIQAPDNQCQPDVAWGPSTGSTGSPQAGSGQGGENFLVVWRHWIGDRYAVYAARVSPEGKLADAKGFKIAHPPDIPHRYGGSSSLATARVSAAGGKWLVTFIAGGIVQGAPGPNGLFAAPVAADGKVLPMTQPVVAEKGVKGPVTLAGNGKDGYLASWSNLYTGGRGGTDGGLPFGATRVGTDGKAMDNVVLGGACAPLRMPEAAWDGKGYLIANWVGVPAAVWYNQERKFINRIAVHLIAADGKYEGAVTVSSGEPRPGFAPAVAGDGKGSALVVYERHPADNDPPEAPIVIAAKMVKR